MTRIALVAVLIVLATDVRAQRIVKVYTDQREVAVQTAVQYTVELQPGAGAPWCGIKVVFSDGTTRNIRVESLKLTVDKTFEAAGDHSVTVTGTALRRGLNSVFGCDGTASSTPLLVFDPEKRQLERDKANTQAAELERQRQEIEQLKATLSKVPASAPPPSIAKPAGPAIAKPATPPTKREPTSAVVTPQGGAVPTRPASASQAIKPPPPTKKPDSPPLTYLFGPQPSTTAARCGHLCVPAHAELFRWPRSICDRQLRDV